MLQRAHAAAKERNAALMIELLAKSQFLDGQVWRIRNAYPRLGLQGAEDVVSEAVGQLYRSVADSERRLVEKPDAYITKAVLGIAYDIVENRRREKKATKARALIEHQDEGDGASQDVLRAEAVRVARALVSRLGQQNVQRVMDYVLDAVEQREPVARQEIAAALDLKPNTVSKLIERGFTRLARVAEEEGYDLKIEDALEIEDEDMDNEDEDEDDREED